MRVYDLNLTGPAGGAGRSGSTGAERTHETREAELSRAGGAAPAPERDRVEFSNTLGRLSQALSSDNAGRAARVRQLEAQYQAGAYHADVAATSRGMINDALAG